MSVAGRMESSVRRRKVEKQKPDRPRDRLLGEVLDLIEGMSAYEASGNVIGRSTVSNWRRGKVMRPQAYTLSAALAAIGKELAIRTIRRQ